MAILFTSHDNLRTTIIQNLVKSNQNVTPNAGRQMHLSLKIKLNTHSQGSSLQVSLFINRATEQVS